MPKFGPRKVGQANFEASKLRETAVRKFGPRKFGVRKAAQMKAELDAADAKAAGIEPVDEAPPVTVDTTVTATSIKQVDEALKENPALYEELYALEVARPDGPRKGALRIFLAAEMNLEGGPRDERLEQIQDLLKPKR